MEFGDLHRDTDCRCISAETVENTVDEFLMAIRNEEVELADFRSLWEKGARGKEPDCNEVCRRKGVSMNKLRGDNLDRILRKYRTTLANKPRGPRYYCRLRCNANGGVFWDTPTKTDDSHHDFFKADGFDLSKVMILETRVL